MKRSLVLGGMKHCGKSTHAAILAEKFNCEFIDTDTYLEELYCLKHYELLGSREIYRKHGEEFFRRLEAEAIAKLAKESKDNTPRIFALGGGVPSNRFLKKEDLYSLGGFIYLAIDSSVAYARVKAKGLPPFLLDKENPEEAFEELYQQRDKFYRQYADVILVINGNESISKVSEKLLQLEIVNE